MCLTWGISRAQPRAVRQGEVLGQVSFQIEIFSCQMRKRVFFFFLLLGRRFHFQPQKGTKQKNPPYLGLLQ